MDITITRFDIFLVNLDPTIGSEIKKKRPCLVISPDEINKYLNTVIIAPMTASKNKYPSRVISKFKGMEGNIALDQMRTVDKIRLITKMGKLETETQIKVISTLQEMFSI